MSGRNDRLIVQLSKEEKGKIQKKAEECAMPISCYVRFISLKAVVTINEIKFNKGELKSQMQ